MILDHFLHVMKDIIRVIGKILIKFIDKNTVTILNFQIFIIVPLLFE